MDVLIEQWTLKSEIPKFESSIPTSTFNISIVDFETEAANSIVTWYHDATRCYVYLSDVLIRVRIFMPMSSRHGEPR